MEPWMAWLLAALGLGVLDLLSGGSLVLLMVGAGALAAAAVSVLTDNAFLPWLAFCAVSIGMLFGVRPLARQHRRQPAALRTGPQRLVGTDAQVLTEVDGRDGRIKLDGEVWSARAFDGESTFPAGSTVQVMQISGATALVA